MDDAKTLEEWCVLYFLTFGGLTKGWQEGEREFLDEMCRELRVEIKLDFTLNRDYNQRLSALALIEEWYGNQRRGRQDV